jgi:hypothetical protein
MHVIETLPNRDWLSVSSVPARFFICAASPPSSSFQQPPTLINSFSHSTSPHILTATFSRRFSRYKLAPAASDFDTRSLAPVCSLLGLYRLFSSNMSYGGGGYGGSRGGGGGGGGGYSNGYDDRSGGYGSYNYDYSGQQYAAYGYENIPAVQASVAWFWQLPLILQFPSHPVLLAVRVPRQLCST